MDNLVGGKVTRDKLSGMYGLLEHTQYLYVRVVKVKDLPAKDVTGSCDPYVEVRMGNYTGMAFDSDKKTDPEWDCVYAFSKDRIQASVVEVTVKDKDVTSDDFLGWVVFDLTEVPNRVPPESPLVPQWYGLEDRKGNKLKGELMLAVWWGTQADESFSEAWFSDAAIFDGVDGLAHTRSKVYLSPKLWYLRVKVIEAKDLVPSHRTRIPEVIVKVTLGIQALTTKISTSRSINPTWNDGDLMFVAAEPFEEHLIISVEDRIAPNNYVVIGMCAVHLLSVERRLDDKAIKTRWFNLETEDIIKGETKEIKLPSKIHTAICLEGGYHVLDEFESYSSDHRPTAKKLWKKSIGVLEVGFLSASGLLPMKTKYGRETTDAYCVAKYGGKWIRTRTIIDSFNPKWNEQYSWEVYDPCTVITIVVFDNCHLQGRWTRDSRIGKVRIRLSTLETDCVYSHAYPLLTLLPSGVKKMGYIHLAVRFTCNSFLNMIHTYSQPLFPKMHNIHPFSTRQLFHLRHHAMQIVSKRLSYADPPLKREVVEYMLDVDSRMWSLRRSKATYFRILGVINGPLAALKWFDDIRNWKHPITTVLVHFVFVILVLNPEFILPSGFLCLVLLGVWYHRWIPSAPPHLDTHLSCAENAHPDELEEEFDTFPTSSPSDIVRMRYDRLRSICGRLQTVFAELATHGERLQSLLSWRDPRATALFVIFCFIAAVVLYAKPFYVVVIQTGFIVLNHPRFQHNLPLIPLNFFKRLPTKTDYML